MMNNTTNNKRIAKNTLMLFKDCASELGDKKRNDVIRARLQAGNAVGSGGNDQYG